MKSLQLMIQTYRENPKFGDVKNFECELEDAVLRVQQLQASLHSLRSQVEEVNLALENLKLGGGLITADSTSVSPSEGLTKKTVCGKDIEEVSGYASNNKVSGEGDTEQQDIFDCHPAPGGTDIRLTNADFLHLAGGLTASKYENENTSDWDWK